MSPVQEIQAIDEEQTVEINGVSIQVIEGDITELQVDAIVNSGNTYMELGGSRSVAGAVVSKAGPAILEDLDEKDLPIPLGAVVTTAGFDLPCRHVIHIATHGTDEEEEATGLDPETLRLKAIGDGVANAIDEACRMRCKTLALPLLAAGTLRAPVSLIIPALVAALNESIAGRKKPSLERVMVVVKRDPAIADFTRRVIAGDWGERGAGAAGFGALALSSALGPIGWMLTTPYWLLQSVRNKKARTDPKSQLWKNIDKLGPRKLKALADELIHQNFNLQQRTRELGDQLLRLQASEQKEGALRFAAESARLPLPAAYAIGMVAAEVDPLARVENLRKALSIVLRYLAAIALAEYQAARHFSAGLNARLQQAFSRKVTDGTWLAISAEIGRAFLQREPSFLKTLATIWMKDQKTWAPLRGTLDKLVKLRNEIHEAGRVDETTARAWLDNALPVWDKAIEQAMPLLRHRLFFLERPDDVAEDKVRYLVRWLVGDHFTPRTEFTEWSTKLPKRKLYLTNRDQSAFLPLWPYLDYEHCEITRAREVCSLDHFQGDQLHLATFRFPYSFPKQGVSLPFADV